jgi:small-conductance mechanosensitive channel
MRTITVGALLAVFVVAVLAALASRLLPGGLAGVVARKFREGGGEPESGETPGGGEGGSEQP